jgi:hypothetical protein
VKPVEEISDENAVDDSFVIETAPEEDLKRMSRLH